MLCHSWETFSLTVTEAAAVGGGVAALIDMYLRADWYLIRRCVLFCVLSCYRFNAIEIAFMFSAYEVCGLD